MNQSKSVGNVILSDNKKIVIDFEDVKGLKNKLISIPSGVEEIEDKVFLKTKFNQLLIPKELKKIGKYTLRNNKNYPKELVYIKVEEGNQFFYTDKVALYRLEGDKKVLEYVFDHSITNFVFPSDVVSAMPYAFVYCNKLKTITLSDSVEEYNENILPERRKELSVFISKSVKQFVIDYALLEEKENRIKYQIDEDNMHLFKDEDSIYEVLEDGTYKLLINTYYGKGRALILKGTKEIAQRAFYGHHELSNLELPDTVRCIGKEAFAECIYLKKVDKPKGLKKIAKDAFNNCHSLYLNNPITYFAERIRKEIGEDSIIMDDINRKIYITYPVKCLDITSEECRNQYLECAKELKVGDKLKVEVSTTSWFLSTMSAKEFGVLRFDRNFILSNKICFLKYFSINSCLVQENRYKPDSRENETQECVWIQIELQERKPVEPLNQEDIWAREMFDYYIENDEVYLVRWLGDPMEGKCIIPAMIEGLPVTTLCNNLFDYHYNYKSKGRVIHYENNIREVIIPFGVKRIEWGALSKLKYLEKIVFPETIEYISPYLFASRPIICRKDTGLNVNAIYVAPQDSYAEAFLKSYRIDGWSFQRDTLIVVNDDKNSAKGGRY